MFPASLPAFDRSADPSGTARIGPDDLKTAPIDRILHPAMVLLNRAALDRPGFGVRGEPSDDTLDYILERALPPGHPGRGFTVYDETIPEDTMGHVGVSAADKFGIALGPSAFPYEMGDRHLTPRERFHAAAGTLAHELTHHELFARSGHFKDFEHASPEVARLGDRCLAMHEVLAYAAEIRNLEAWRTRPEATPAGDYLCRRLEFARQQVQGFWDKLEPEDKRAILDGRSVAQIRGLLDRVPDKYKYPPPAVSKERSPTPQDSRSPSTSSCDVPAAAVRSSNSRPAKGSAAEFIQVSSLRGLNNRLDAEQLNTLRSLLNRLSGLHGAMASERVPSEKLERELAFLMGWLQRFVCEPYGAAWGAGLRLNELFLDMLSSWVRHDTTGKLGPLAARLLLSASSDGLPYHVAAAGNIGVLPALRTLVEAIRGATPAGADKEMAKIALSLNKAAKNGELRNAPPRVPDRQAITESLGRIERDLDRARAELIAASDRLARSARDIKEPARDLAALDTPRARRILEQAAQASRDSLGRLNDHAAVANAERHLQRSLHIETDSAVRSRLSSTFREMADESSLDAAVRRGIESQTRAHRETQAARAREDDEKTVLTDLQSERLYRAGQQNALAAFKNVVGGLVRGYESVLAQRATRPVPAQAGAQTPLPRTVAAPVVRTEFVDRFAVRDLEVRLALLNLPEIPSTFPAAPAAPAAAAASAPETTRKRAPMLPA